MKTLWMRKYLQLMASAGRRDSFPKGVASSRLPTLQGKAPYPYDYMYDKHKLNFLKEVNLGEVREWI